MQTLRMVCVIQISMNNLRGLRIEIPICVNYIPPPGETSKIYTRIVHSVKFLVKSRLNWVTSCLEKGIFLHDLTKSLYDWGTSLRDLVKYLRDWGTSFKEKGTSRRDLTGSRLERGGFPAGLG